jgi:hypothetical protein
MKPHLDLQDLINIGLLKEMIKMLLDGSVDHIIKLQKASLSLKMKILIIFILIILFGLEENHLLQNLFKIDLPIDNLQRQKTRVKE